MTFERKYSNRTHNEALDLLREAEEDGMSIMQACEQVSTLLAENADIPKSEIPKSEKLRKWAKEANLFPGSNARTRTPEQERARICTAIAKRVAEGSTVKAACEQVADEHQLRAETVRAWHYDYRNTPGGASNEPGESAVRETVLEMLGELRERGLPMKSACRYVVREFTDGPTYEQVRDWAIDSGTYSWTDRAYSADFRNGVLTQMAELVQKGATATAAATTLAAEGYASWATFYAWYKESNSDPDEDDSVEPDDIEYVDLDKFRAEVEAPLLKELSLLREQTLDQAERGSINGLRARVVDLEQQNIRLTEELKRLRALVRHYIDTD